MFKKIILSVFFICLFSTQSFAKLKVVTTLPDFSSIAQEIGKDLIEVQSLAKGNQDPHFLEPKPSYAVALNKADLFMEAGLELESGWVPPLLTQARNPKIQKGAAGYLNLSKGIRILEIPQGTVDRSQGDIHPQGNPHYWLNPINGGMIAKQISDKLSELDPNNKNSYQKNYQDFLSQLNTKIKQWEARLQKIKNKKIITQHRSFSYFADWAKLQVIDYIEPKPGIPPSSAHLLQLMGKMKTEQVALIITENYYDIKTAQQISQKTSIPYKVLPTSVGGMANINNYFSLIDYLISQLGV